MARPITTAPPTKKQIEAIKEALKRCQFIETAASMAGIPRTQLRNWISLGRKGRPGFVEFTNAVDEATSKLSSDIMEEVYKRAFEERSLPALKWLWEARCKPREEAAWKRELELEERMDALDEESQASEEDVAAAEARALAALADEERVH